MINRFFAAGLAAFIVIATASLPAQAEAPAVNALAKKAKNDKAKKQKPKAGPIQTTATIQHVKPKGSKKGFYGIVTKGKGKKPGKRYVPTNLPEAFQKDGIRVQVKMRVMPPKKNEKRNPWGAPVRIGQISLITDPK